MRQAKLGVVFVIAVMALAGAAAGYAMWSQTLTITGIIETGEFCVGIRDDGTGDPGDYWKYDETGGDLYPHAGEYPTTRTLDAMDGTTGTWDLNYPPGDSEGKNIGETESTNGEEKEIHEELQYYHDITETIYNAYPYYQTWITITFANCGTIPAKINSGGWTIETGTDLTNLLPWVKVDEIWIVEDFHGYQSEEAKWYGVIPYEAMEGFQYQLDPCDTLTFVILFHFEEYADYNGDGTYQDDGDDADSDPDLLPEGATMRFTYDIEWAQWNEVGDPITVISGYLQGSPPAWWPTGI